MLIDSLGNKHKILDHFLELISEGNDWNKFTLLEAFTRADIDPKFLRLIFKDECLELSEFYIAIQNEKILTTDISALRTSEKVKQLLLLRFKVEDQKHLQALINFLSKEKRAAAFKFCYAIADFIWEVAGDGATDFNYYTKRLILAKIIFRSVPIYLRDESELSRSIDEQIKSTLKFAKFKSKVSGLFQKFDLQEILFDENKMLKRPAQILSELPFFRLRKKFE